MMTSNFQSMHHTCAFCAMSAQKAACVCAWILLGSAILVESIFVALISIVYVISIILVLTEPNTA